MKRDQIINKIEEIAKAITPEAVKVFTNGINYPKCQLCYVSEYIGGYARPGEPITPYMRPTELLAYCNGMAAALN